jgi:phenylalanyl-tRNA synthetase beta chain
MKISYNWLKDYIACDLTPEQIGEVLTAIGLEVEGIDKVETIPGGLKGVVVGEVLTCEKHPDADRLRITTVNLGEGEPVQIVCGAPNVEAGQKVLVATVGTTLFPSGGESFTIKKSKIRGAESIGMICAEDELGLGGDHGGIIVLDASAVPGTAAATQLDIKTDFCLEIGLTPNRTDAFSHYGVARDLAAALRNMEGIEKHSFTLSKPELISIHENEKSPVAVEVLDSEATPRYAGVTITGVKVGPSPKWMQERLATIGLRPINNIVDITNYIQHEIGQPLHAFDADKIGGRKVVVRRGNDGESFTTLDGVERKLTSEDLMICDSEKPMCIAGVFGGLESGVTDSTTSIFLESAYFNPVVVRKTARCHGLHTDASFRFERGADPEITLWALKRAIQFILESAGGEVSSKVIDIYPTPFSKEEVKFKWANCNRLIGQEIPRDRVKQILSDLEITIASETSEELSLNVPHYRADVTREADVVEDILRIYGYNNIDFPKGLNSSLSFAPKPDPEKIQNKVSDFLAASGFNEIMCMSLTKAKYAEILDEEGYLKDNAVELLNPLSQDLGIMRQTILFGGLESIELNQNHKNPDLRLFEFGKTYRKIEGKYVENMMLGIWLSGRRNPESWNTSNDAVSFADLKSSVENILRVAGINGWSCTSTTTAQWSDGLQYSLGKKIVARLGVLDSKIQKAFDIKQAVLYAELNWENLISLLPKNAVQYKPAEKFPPVRRDLSLLMDKNVRFADVEKISFDAERKLLRQVGLFDVYEGKNLEEGKKSYAVSFILQDSTKTMTDQQVDSAMDRVRKALDEKLGAKVRG